MIRIFYTVCFLGVASSSLHAEPISDRRVRESTRFDWDFVLGPEPGARGKLPVHYDPKRQRSQFFVPEKYKPADGRAWPLVVFLSAGDVPVGWRLCAKACSDEGRFFCAPYALGNTVAPEQRLRATLDIIDDIRREYRIDPQQTYLFGVGEAADIAGRIAFSLPDHFGGVVAIDGDLSLPRIPWLRQRLRERLSVALIANKGSLKRDRVEGYLGTLFAELKVRNRVWIGEPDRFDLPQPETIGEVFRWLDEDVKRRQEDLKTNPFGSEEAPSRSTLARLGVATAEKGLARPGDLARTVALLEYITLRCGRADDADKAAKMLRDLRSDPEKNELLLNQSEADARTFLKARAAAHEKVGEFSLARGLWVDIGRISEEADRKKIESQIERLDMLMSKKPWFGLRTVVDSTRIKEIVGTGPAEKAGLRVGDTIESLNKKKTETVGDLRKVLGLLKPGETVTVQVLRGGKSVEVRLVVGVAAPE